MPKSLLDLINKPDREKLEAVNQFFNSRTRYASDFEVWGVSEYWATPNEFLERKAGDCEDYAIAKYFALIRSGMTDDVLRIVYGRLVTFREPHMVLYYLGAPVLVLDNVVDKILTEQERSDLVPILAFNRSGLWTFKRGKMELTSKNSKRLSKWRELQERMNAEIPV
jgi:predicted transglutaminase-like cysteine proteinase